MSSLNIRKAIVPALGWGTRLLPATKATPKEMLPIFDRPAVQYIVDEAAAAGIEHVVFVTGRNRAALQDYFDRAFELEDALRLKGDRALLSKMRRETNRPGSVSFVRQQAPGGLGHAILCAREIIGDEPFAVLLPDILIHGRPGATAQLVRVSTSTGANVLGVERGPRLGRFGGLEASSKKGRRILAKRLVETPDADDALAQWSLTGRYVFQPRLFEVLADQRAAKGEARLLPALETLRNAGQLLAYEHVGRAYDCGEPLGRFAANVAFALADKRFGEAATPLLRQELRLRQVGPSGRAAPVKRTAAAPSGWPSRATL